MLTVPVNIKDHPYTITIGRDLLSEISTFLQGKAELVVITDSNIKQLPWFNDLIATLRQQSNKCLLMGITAGESSKSLDTFSECCSRLAENAFSRKTTVIAIGGGVVGDLAGYIAASYLRGVRFVQIATTLMAAVDSSVGGKTGVNLPEGKNLVGAFYQPEAVFIDLNYLDTLPEREFNSGMAEVIKYGIIWDKPLFDRVANGFEKEELADIIQHCCEIKAEVVKQDEKETTGLRAVLNYGHTIGHAVEQLTHYEKYLHGEAVGIGMVAASKISHELAGMKQEDVDAIKKAVEFWKLPTTHPDLDWSALEPVIMRDKKSDGTSIKWILSPSIGETKEEKNVTEEVIKKAIA
jgi:3-dehydroquinate synthase